jgi:hypothetical protein
MRILLLLTFAACSGDAEDTGKSGRPGGGDTGSGDTGSGDTGSGDTDSADTGADSADTGGGDTGDTDTGGLPDARDRMVRSGEDCEEIAGHDDVPAARLWYWGELHGDAESGFTGEEAWYFYGNTAWYARGLEDCEVHFELSSITVGSGGACTTCDFGVTLEADVDLDATTCPAALYRGYAHMEEAYAIEELGDGSASWYFPGSGNLLGDGYWNELGVNYLADGGCSLAVD